MLTRPSSLAGLLLLALAPTLTIAAEEILPPINAKKEGPQLRLNPPGPTSQITTLAFGPKGSTLYVAGFDKVVRVWKKIKGEFQLQDKPVYRIPIAPGVHGAINAIALSDDEEWLAVGGQGVYRGLAGVQEVAAYRPKLGVIDEVMRRDQGLIYVFNTKDRTKNSLLRANEGPILNLQFAPSQAGKVPLLVSFAKEGDSQSDKNWGRARLWDVDNKTSLAVSSTLPSVIARPEIAIRSIGKTAKEVQISLSLGDGKFRVWEPSSGAISDAKAPSTSFCTASLPQANRVLTAAPAYGAPQLTRWQILGGQPVKPDHSRAPGGEVTVPFSMAPLKLNNGNAFDAVAMVVYRPSTTKPGEYLLQILGLEEGNYGKLIQETKLWQGRLVQPTLIVSPDEKYLAVAGNLAHDIRIFSLSKPNGKLKLLQPPIQSQGEAFGTAALLVNKKGEHGLLLRSAKKRSGGLPAELQAGDLIFEMETGQLTANRTGWALDIPAVGGWSWLHLPEKGKPVEITIRQNGRVKGTVKLPKGYALSDHAILPPMKPWDIPLLAVASHIGGQPMLGLYHGETGEMIRLFRGHLGPISSVAFSANGFVLISASEDQTVCAWPLRNLDRVLGKVGRLQGVVVKEAAQGVEVASVDSDSPLVNRIKPGQIIEGVVQKKQLRAVTSPLDFYQAIELYKPGENVELKIGAQRANLLVGQGTDGSNTLFTFFVTRGNKPEAREWIGWSSMGPYEFAGPNIENLLGWHTNTGRAAEPVTHVKAAEHRKEYYEPKLLARLTKLGEYKPKINVPKPPRMTLFIEENGIGIFPDKNGHFFVRSPTVTLHVKLEDREARDFKTFQWRVQGKPFVPFDLTDPSKITAKIPLDVEINTVQVVATTPTEKVREHSEDIKVRYQPPAPEITLIQPKDARQRSEVLKPVFEVKARVAPGLQGKEVDVFVYRGLPGIRMAKKPIPLVQGVISANLKLEPGDNIITMEARNREALAGFTEHETEVISFKVSLVEKGKAPKITLTRITPENGLAQPLGAGEIVVPVPQVTIEGLAQSEKDLVALDWYRDKEVNGTKVVLGEKTAKGVPFQAQIKLKPGPQIIRFEGQAQLSDTGRAEVRLLYQPPLPIVKELTPSDPVRYIVGKDPKILPIQAVLKPVDDPQPFDATLLINGKPSQEKVTILNNTLSAKVPLEFGSNRIELRLTNEWGASATFGPILAEYVRPPIVQNWMMPANQKKSTITTTIDVASAIPLIPGATRVTLTHQRDDRNLDVNQIKLIPPKAQNPTQWQVQLSDIPLLEGDNKITFIAANAEAESESVSRTIRFTPPKPLTVTILNPSGGAPTYNPVTNLSFVVKSEVPITEVLYTLNNKTPTSIPLNKATQKGIEYHFGPIPVPLARGSNRLLVRASAGKDGGSNTDSRLITYVHKAVRVEVTGFVDLKTNEKFIPKLDGDTLIVPKIPSGIVEIQGRVIWDDAQASDLRKNVDVRIFVNAYQQLPASLKDPQPGTTERVFRHRILLNNEQNLIKIDLPFAQEDHSLKEFKVACAMPEKGRRLHLFVVSTEGIDAEKTKERFYKAFNIDPNDKTKAIKYAPLTAAAANPKEILRGIELINYRIQSAQQGAPGSDIVIFYFKGGEAINQEGELFPTAIPGHTKLNYQELADLFAKTPGAHILLYDVDRATKNIGAKSSEEEKQEWAKQNLRDPNNFIPIRYAWLNGNRGKANGSLVQAIEKISPGGASLSEITNDLEEHSQSQVNEIKTLIYSTLLPGWMRPVQQ